MHCVAAFQRELIHFSSLIALDVANTHIHQDFFAPTTRITQQDQALWCPTGKVGLRLRPAPPDGSVRPYRFIYTFHYTDTNEEGE